MEISFYRKTNRVDYRYVLKNSWQVSFFLQMIRWFV